MNKRRLTIMFRPTLDLLNSHRRPLAVGGAIVVAALGLLTARAAGALDGTPLGVTDPSPSPTAGVAAAAAASPSPAGSNGGGRGPNNVVNVVNHTDAMLKARGNIQVNHIHGPVVEPGNGALAYGSCLKCDTFAVALQINLYANNSTTVAPQNVATATNYRCTGCVTVAVAYQYDIPVADPDQVPDRVNQLKAQMDQELHNIANGPGVTLQQAVDRINAVISQYQDLAGYLTTQRQESNADTDPGATPLPDPSASPSAAATPGPASPSPSAAASPTPATSPAASPSPSP